MSYVTVPSYEGNQPYIYVYYAEEDTRLALPVLARLYNEGLRMWSWNGCSTPTDVRASQRISSCAALLIFLSDNLNRDIDRGYFEAMEALRCNKVKYFVRLSDVELPFDWGRSETNVIIDYVRSNEAAFWLSVYDSDIIERCRGAWPSQPVKVGMSVFDSIDSGELSDEYSNILKIIGDSPALDRSGAPVNAEDIALFAGAGESSEKPSEREVPQTAEPPLDDLNRRSMEDLFGMLDEISVSTRRRSEELQQAAIERRQAQEKAALARASLPFQQDVVTVDHPEELPAPTISFNNTTPHWTETAAAAMFGADRIPDIIKAPSANTAEPEQTELFAGEMFGELPPIAEDTAPEEAEIAEPEEITEEVPEAPSFEAFIDELTAKPAAEAPAEKEPEPAEDEPSSSEPEEENEENSPVPMATNPITVEISEVGTSYLLPPASGSLTGFVLPDDNYISTVYVMNDEEGDPRPSAAERAAAAEESRRQFESALEKAAYLVTGRIVARHSDGEGSVGLRVRKPKARRISINARVKTVKVSPVPIQKTTPEPAAEAEVQPSRSERRSRRSRRSRAAEEIPSETAVTAEESRKLTVTPEPMRGEPPAAILTPSEPIAEPAPSAQPAAPAEAEGEPAVSRRKKRHPHNSSGLLDLLRTLRTNRSAEQSDETEDEEQQ